MRVVLVLFAALLFVHSGFPGAAVGERTHVIQLEDYFTLAYATSCELSPRGTYVTWTEMRWEKETDRRNTDLWVADVETKEFRRLTFDPASDGSPRWSPDEQWIYFTSARGDDDRPPYNGKTQVWRVSPAGGEVVPVTRMKDGVKSFRLSRDGKTLYYLTGRKKTDDDPWKDLRDEFPDLKYGHGITEYRTLWKLELVTWRTEKLVDEDRFVFEFEPSPDGSRIALLTRPTPELITNEGWSRVEIYDASTGAISVLDDQAWREEAPSPYGWLLGLTWSDDGRILGFRVDFDGYPGEVFFAHFGEGDPRIQRLVRPDEVTVEGGMTWMPGTHNFCFTADDRGHRPVFCVEDIDGGQGRAYTLTPHDVSVNDFSFGPGRMLAVLRPGLDHPPDVFVTGAAGPDARYDRITRINPQVDTWKVPQISIARWTSYDGTPVEGILELPPDYEPGSGPLPLVVAIHGGPTSSSRLHFRFWIYGHTLFPAKGWAVLDVNYRGSTGYGDRFLTDLIGHKNDRDVADILSGVDYLIAEGIVDSSRMAVMGWSNGGYLTNCIITRDPRFKAASSGAGVFDTVMQWSIEDTPGHVINYSRGLPWEDEGREVMHRTSPLYAVDKVRAATLIHVGENDPRVPPEHARALYRALRHYLHVPVELIVYPGEGHGLTRYTHRLAKLKWDHRWFEHYVLGENQEPESE